jgi:hypothetical protein
VSFRESIADYIPATVVALLIATLSGSFAFLAVYALAAWRALGIDFVGYVGLPIAGVVAIGSFIVAFRKFRPRFSG